MTPHADTQPEQGQPADALITDELMSAITSGVLAATGRDTDSSRPRVTPGDAANLRLDELGIDSLLVAEIVVELEQRLGVLLELAANGGMETLAQLRDALRPVDVT